jgi:hypothetical protein
MYILVIFVLFSTGDPSNPISIATRDPVGFYESIEACEADTNRAGARFLSELGVTPELAVSKCVVFTGTSDTPQP